MKSPLFLVILLVLCPLAGFSAFAESPTLSAAVTPPDSAVSPRRPFEGYFHCAETNVDLHMNLYEEELIAPGFDFLGPMHAYLQGPGIYGTWMSTRVQINGKKAVVRFSNDIGSESQDIELVQVSDSILTYRATGGNAIRKAVGHKLVKVTDQMTFRLK